MDEHSTNFSPTDRLEMLLGGGRRAFNVTEGIFKGMVRIGGLGAGVGTEEKISRFEITKQGERNQG